MRSTSPQTPVSKFRSLFSSFRSISASSALPPLLRWERPLDASYALATCPLADQSLPELYGFLEMFSRPFSRYTAPTLTLVSVRFFIFMFSSRTWPRWRGFGICVVSRQGPKLSKPLWTKSLLLREASFKEKEDSLLGPREVRRIDGGRASGPASAPGHRGTRFGLVWSPVTAVRSQAGLAEVAKQVDFTAASDVSRNHHREIEGAYTGCTS